MIAFLLAVSAVGAAAVAGLDHVPIAVRDLDTAAAAYRRLGFSLKPGRAHENGLRNVHAKFPDGTELELITAPEVRDPLTAKYRKHLEAGDGPAFLALFAPSGAPEVEKPFYVFFGRRNHSPTDRPEHFAHENTAGSLIAVWLAGELTDEQRMLTALKAPLVVRDVHVPDRMRATVARLPEGEILLLPASRQLVGNRPIVGATVRVRSLDTARATLARNGVPVRVAGTSVFIAPESAHGLWLEMRE